MSRIPALTYEKADPQTQKLWREVEETYGSVSQMKAVLIHSPAALHAALEWYALYKKTKPYLGERRILLFSNAISRENACTLCATYMNAALKKSGEDPDSPTLDDKDKALVDYGRQLARDPNRVRDELFERLRAYFTDAQIVEITTFGALMILNNVFNGALQVDLDAHLKPYVVEPDRAFADSSKYQKEPAVS